MDKAATLQEIHKAYHELAKEWHPDTCKLESSTCEEKFVALTSAYEVRQGVWSVPHSEQAKNCSNCSTCVKTCLIIRIRIFPTLDDFSIDYKHVNAARGHPIDTF